MSIQKLSEAEKNFAISEIVEKGVVKPGDKFRKMLEVGRVCTFHTLFFGVGDCFLLGLLIAACIWLLLIQAGSQVIICMVFAVSPFAATLSHPTKTAWISPCCIRLADILSQSKVTSIPAEYNSNAVKRAPCKRGRVSSA